MIKFNKLFRNLYTKALSIGVVMMLGLGIVNGQVNLTLAGSTYVQNFDNATSLTAIQWNMFDVNTDGNPACPATGSGIWEIRDIPCQSGGTTSAGRGGTGKAAQYGFSTPNAANDWMFSPSFSLAASTPYKFVYWYRASGATAPAYPEKMKAMITTGSTPTTAIAGVPASSPLKQYTDFTSGTYVKDSIMFTPASAGTFYIAFKAESIADQYFIAVDDFSAQNMNIPLNDVSVTTLTTAATSTNCATFTATTQFTVTVQNFGSADQSNFPVNWVIIRGATIVASGTQNITSLASGATTTFNITGDLTIGGTYSISASAALVGDTNSSNNGKLINIFNPLADLTVDGSLYQQGFEGVTTLAQIGWSTVDVNTDTKIWRVFTNATFSNTGTNFAICFRSATVATNDYLVSNCLKLKGGEMYRVTYYRRANGGTTEKLKTFWGNAPTAAGLSNQIGTEETFTNASYSEINFTFTPPTDGVYYIGFQQTSDVIATDGTAGIIIDDIAVVNIPNVDIAMKSTSSTSTDCGGFSATTQVNTRVWNSGTAPLNTSAVTFKYKVRSIDNFNTVPRPVVADLVPETTITVPASTMAVNDSLSLPALTIDMSTPRGYVVEVYADFITGSNKINDTVRTIYVNRYRNLAADNSVYSENFDSGDATLAWRRLNLSTATGTTAPTNWGTFNSATFAASGTGGFFASAGTAAASNAWLFSPCTNMVTGKVYTVSFKYRADATGTIGKLKMVLVTAPTAAATTTGTLIQDYPSITLPTYTTAATQTFVVPTTGNYHIAFQLYSDADANQGSVLIDDYVLTNTGPLQPPAAPATLTATPAPLQIDLSWTASTSTGITAPTSYRLDMSTTSASAGFTTLFTTPNATTLTYSHLNLTAGTTYFYRVYATNSAGTSTLFAAGSAVPNPLSAPSSLTIAAQTTGNVLNLTWTASPTATGYSIERATIGAGGAVTVPYAEVGTSTTANFTNTGLTTGTIYRYKVRASKGSPLQYSAYSNEATSAAVLELEQNAFSKQIVLSPNPNEGNFKVNMTNVKPNRVTFVMTDMTGKEVHRSTGDNEDNFNFNMSGLSKGTYLLYINTDKGQGVKRVVVK